MCTRHLKRLLRYTEMRRSQRIKAKLCIDCANMPQFWGLRCVICRQRHSVGVLPPGARKALAKYRQRDTVAVRVQQAQVAVDRLKTYNPRLISPHAVEILTMRHGLSDHIDRTLEEVGAAFSVTRERIRQIEKKTLDRLDRHGLDVSLLRGQPVEARRPASATRSHLVSDEKRKHAHAHGLVKKALDAGELTKQPCEAIRTDGRQCGETETVGHHPDYDKPLEVQWLCRGHHMRAHGRGTGDPRPKQQSGSSLKGSYEH